MGGRPDPIHLKLVKGVRRKDRLSKGGPRTVKRGLPSPPKYLDSGAREEWQEVVGDLHDAGILAVTDRMILANYCQAVSRWRSVELALQDLKALDPSGVYISPLVGVANRTLVMVSRLCGELGMTPSSRGRVHVLPEDRTDPAEKYLVE